MAGPTTRPPASRDTDITEEIEAALRGEVNMSATSGSGNGNGNKALQAWVLGILQTLVIAGILGIFAKLSGIDQQMIETKTIVTERGRQNDRDFQRIDATLQRHDDRITELEREQSPAQSDANHRQKR